MSKEDSIQPITISNPPSLDDLVALNDIKQAIHSIRTSADYWMAATLFGASLDVGMQNTLIVGSQGSGKTTIAKVLASEFRKNGFVRSTATIHFVEALQLIGKYIGQSEERTKNLLYGIPGDILILDEIDSLLDAGSFGYSVLNTLNAFMGNHPNSPLIIATCYETRKAELLRANLGLEGRFCHIHYMPRYDISDLVKMYIQKIHRAGLLVEDGVQKAVHDTLTQAKKEKGASFANAREVQNLFDVTLVAHAERLQREGADLSQYSRRV